MGEEQARPGIVLRDNMGRRLVLSEEVYVVEDCREMRALVERVEAAEAAFRRCSPSAPWSVKHDLAQRGVHVEYGYGASSASLDYPIGHLARLAGELAAIFGQQAPERLRELGTSDEVIAEIKGRAALGVSREEKA